MIIYAAIGVVDRSVFRGRLNRDPTYISVLDKEEISTMAGNQNKKTFDVNGTTVYVHRAGITTIKVDAIVNAANSELSHGAGVAKAIADAAGRALVDEGRNIIKRRGPLNIADVVETTPGKITSCRKVLHTVGPQWPKINADTKGQNKCCDQLKLTFKNVFKFANHGKYRSIAVPPISSSIYGMPGPHVAEAMVKAIKSFAFSNGNKYLREIHVIDIKDDILDLVSGHLKKSGYDKGAAGQAVAGQRQNTKLRSSTRKRAHDDDTFTSSKLARKSGVVGYMERTFQLGATQVHVYTCDITDARVQAIVNSTNRKLDMSKGLSAAIYRAAGKQMKQDIIKLQGDLKTTDVVVTRGGNLCKHVFHAIIPRLPKTRDIKTETQLKRKLTRTFEKVLQKAEKYKMKSIAIPPIGSELGGFPAHNVAYSMVKTIRAFALNNMGKHLQEIHVVDTKNDVLRKVISLLDQNN